MDTPKLAIKLSFITGLRDIVLREIAHYENFHSAQEKEDSVYLEFTDIATIKRLRSVARAYVVIHHSGYNPLYISKHKSILSYLIDMVIDEDIKTFRTFKITCAGSDSREVRSIAEYIQQTYGLTEKEDADMKIHIVKLDMIWEIGIQVTPRPLSFRDYKVKNMSGAMDPTIAYAMNSLCNLENANSYLNIFSGSATLLIEAGQCYPNIQQLIGFDNDKKNISLAIQNIRKAGLITKIQLKEENIFDKPSLGIFDAITSDLPFGMAIAKNEDLESLYRCFIEYSETALHRNGTLAIYTSANDIIKKIISQSQFTIVKTLDLKFTTSVNAYLRPKIFVCKLK